MHSKSRFHLLLLYIGLITLLVATTFTLKKQNLMPIKQSSLHPSLEIRGDFYEQPSFATKKTYSNNITAAAIFQNEEADIHEWIEFHRLLGVNHFYLFNHFSQDNSLEKLQTYIKEGLVEVFSWPYEATNRLEWEKVKTGAFSYAIEKARGKTKWLALLDLDDYLYPTKKKTLTEVLTSFEPFGGVVVNRLYFGSSAVKKKPENKLLIEALTWRATTGHLENRHFQSIVRPERVAIIKSPSEIEYIPGYSQVTTNLTPFKGSPSPEVAIDQLRINHYYSKDLTYLIHTKIERRKDDEDSLVTILKKIDSYNQIQDFTILKYSDKVRNAVGYDH